jgi:hypothetical protein
VLINPAASVATNSKGEFSIMAENTSTITVSSVGFTTQQIKVNDQTEMNIQPGTIHLKPYRRGSSGI